MLKIHKKTLEGALLFLCVISLLFNTLIGTAAALGFLISGTLICLLNENKLLHLLAKSWVILAIPLMAIISSLWSDNPLLTLRGAVQLLLTTIFSLMFSAVIRYELFIRVLGGCFFITMLMCLVSDRYALNGMTGEYSLIGIFGSKNFLSMNAAISVFVGIAIYKSFHDTSKFCGGLLILVSFFVLVKSKSLGSTVTSILVITLALFFIAYQKVYLTRLIRSNLNWLMVFLFLMLVFLIIYIGNSSAFDNFMYEVGKDPTLTGRTFIWSRGIENILDNPILGTGYESIFYVGNPLAEEIWEFAHVPSGAGFHFHNMYIDITVQLGILGGLTFIVLLGGFFRLFINNKNLKFSNKEGFALMVFLYMFLQTFLEAGWFSQFTISHFVTCAAWIFLKQATELRSIKLRWNI